jgi:caa(3)-type oxidase subunit IV
MEARVSESKEHSWGAYYVVFNALMLLTVITVGLSYVDVGEILTSGSEFGHQISKGLLPVVEIGHGANIVLGLIVAVIKASLVVWIFMHQNHEEAANRFIFGFSISLLLWAFLAFSVDFVFLGTYAHEFAGAALGTR